MLDRAEYLYLAVCLIGGLVGLFRAFRQVRHDHRPTTAPMDRVGQRRSAVRRSRSSTRCRTRWAGETSVAMKLSAIPLSLIPLAYASAIVRYRLLDIEVIVKRSVIYAAALCAIARDLCGACCRASIACSVRTAGPQTSG